MPAGRSLVDRWLGPGTGGRAVVAVWRLVPWLGVWLVTQPVMRVGRRPYRVGRLAERLEAIRDMEITPEWLPAALRWMSALVVITAVTALVWPRRYRRWHAVIGTLSLVTAAAVLSGADRAGITSPTWQLTAVVVTAAVTVVAAVVPAPQ